MALSSSTALHPACAQNVQEQAAQLPLPQSPTPESTSAYNIAPAAGSPSIDSVVLSSSPLPKPLSTLTTLTTPAHHHADRLGDPAAALRRPQSARAHQGTLDSVPRQTIIKALASVARSHKPEALSLSGVLSATMQPPISGSQSAGLPGTRGSLAAQLSTIAAAVSPAASPALAKVDDTGSETESGSASQLTTALHNLALRSGRSTTPTAPTAPTTAASAVSALSASSAATAANVFSGLKSPCYYHQRFDDAVDIDRVLEDIKNDQYMSHSRLVQTATGVREVSKQLQRRPIRRAVHNVMIVTKARDNQLVLLTRELAQWLIATPRYGSDAGVTVYVDAKLRASRRFGAASIVGANPTRFEPLLRYWTPDLCWSQPEKFDLVITLGGDGTVLFTSWLFQRIVPPVLSFSLGSLGFLTTFEYERFRDHLDRIMGSDGMRVNLRMRFTCTVYRDGATTTSPGATSPGGSDPLEEGEQFEVLNELVIDRGPSPYVSNLELYGDDELLTVVQADGCIFSTPTGSTAYSLSAGGSLVHPDIPAILLTPICPHTLSFRPMVLSDTMLLRVSIPRHSRATAYCAFDGKGRVELKPGDCVTITASQYPFPTVTRTDTEWFDSVSRTLRWNTRAATQKGFDPSLGSGGDSGIDLAAKDDAAWDIDTDSGYYASEEGSATASPLRRQMSMLGM